MNSSALNSMEKDLFEPIRKYFESYGYICDGEVNDIDLYMEKEDSSVAVELKTTLDFRAVQQAALRQKITDHVYIGIPRPKNMRSHAFKDKLYLLKRLGIGLIVVSAKKDEIEIISEPVVSELSSYQKRNQGKKSALSVEFQKRRIKANTGGVHGVQIMSGYREESLLVLDALISLDAESTTKEIRALSHVNRTTSILYNNYYGWFEKVDRGIYRVSEKGMRDYESYRETVVKLKEMNEEGSSE